MAKKQNRPPANCVSTTKPPVVCPGTTQVHVMSDAGDIFVSPRLLELAFRAGWKPKVNMAFTTQSHGRQACVFSVDADGAGGLGLVLAGARTQIEWECACGVSIGKYWPSCIRGLVRTCSSGGIFLVFMDAPPPQPSSDGISEVAASNVDRRTYRQAMKREELIGLAELYRPRAPAQKPEVSEQERQDAAKRYLQQAIARKREARRQQEEIERHLETAEHECSASDIPTVDAEDH